MAWHDDADGVGAIRQADGADSAGAADALGELTIADGFGCGNLAQSAPDFALEGGAGGGGGDVVDGVNVSVEIAGEARGEPWRGRPVW